MTEKINFLTDEEVLSIHRRLAGDGGGLRQEGLLRACLSLPSSKIGGRYTHRDIFEMAAAYLFQLVGTRPFVSHNQSTAALAALYFLFLHGYALSGDPGDYAAMVAQTAGGKTTKLLLADYLRKNCHPARR